MNKELFHQSMALNAAHNHRLESPSPSLLLENVVRTVQFLLDLSAFKHSVFSFVSGFELLHHHVKVIVKHGATVKHHLIFLQTSFATFDTWLESSLLEHSFQHKLTQAVSIDRIRRCYHEWAFLRNEKLFRSLFDCLNSLATRDFTLLNIIPSCFVGIYHLPVDFPMPLIPVPIFPSSMTPPLSQFQESTSSLSQFNSSDAMSHPVSITVSLSKDTSSKTAATRTTNLESILEANQTSEEEDVQTPGVDCLVIPKFSYSYGSPIISVPDFSQLEDSPRLDPMVSCFKSKKAETWVETSISPVTPSHIQYRAKSFLESGGFVQPPALGNFPLPQKGQSLKEFLSSLSDASQPDLDRENSHFNISEALISAFESMKVKQKLKELQEQRHLERMEAMFGEESNRSVRCGGFKCIKKKLPLRQRPELPFTETEESEFEFWRQCRHPPPEIKKKPRVLHKLGSDGRSESLLSTTEATTSGSQSLSSSSEDLNSSSFSAENVALNLLRNARMEEEKFPEASTLKWLVTERDCPQSLLPLPKNWYSNSESESDSLDKSIRLRGTVEWAPPRPQIIFTIHPSPNLQIMMEFQKFRCAGCGVKVQPKYASTHRFCYYLGRYFCSGCHSKKMSRLPQMIIHRWDFSYYQVSNFSATLLESLRFDPVYNILAINPALARKGRIAVFRSYRTQLKFLGTYLQNCKAAMELFEDLSAFPSYYVADPDLYSLEDMIQLRFGTGLPWKVKELVFKAIQHILQCALCRQLGFHCEICKNPEVIFPFQLTRVSRCVKCSTCFHRRCFNPTFNECPKCLRVVSRKQSLGSSSEYVNELPV